MVGRRPPASGPGKQARTWGSRPGPRMWTSARATKVCPSRETASFWLKAQGWALPSCFRWAATRAGGLPPFSPQLLRH
eukprot:5410324-Alexandrium_andersonii.AAC.1